MLILTRRIGEEICIGDGIVIRFLGMDRHHQARFGIEAPKTVPVWRREIYDKIQEEKTRLTAEFIPVRHCVHGNVLGEPCAKCEWLRHEYETHKV